MRLFTAIELPIEIRNHLGGLARQWQAQWGEELLGMSNEEYPRASWVRPENLHITLKFFGDVHEAAVPGLCDALGSRTPAGVSQPIRLIPDRMECLPPRGPVRVIAVGIGGDSKELRDLHRAIEQGTEPVGFPPERRPYHPHITLARAKVPLARHVRQSLAAAGAGHLPADAFAVTEFVLMESRLHRDGAEYARVARFPLVSAPSPE